MFKHLAWNFSRSSNTSQWDNMAHWDGTCNRFWEDSWVGTGPLEQRALCPLTDQMRHAILQSFCTLEGWNLQDLCVWLPPDIVAKIHSIHMSAWTSGTGRRIWRYT